MPTPTIAKPIDITTEATIHLLQTAIQNHHISSQEIVHSYLDKIMLDTNRNKSLNSIVTINPAAIQIAKEQDDNYRQTNTLLPLQGVAIIVKDNIEVAGIATTAGAISLKDNMTKKDAFIIQKLKQVGAIIIAKSNLHEFAIWGETKSSLLGQTYNPYDLTRTPGGSSGGTGASIAADFAVVGLGTDTINSIRSPASANSLVGIRPTMGLVSRTGIIPYSHTQDTAGPIARTVEDAVKVLDVIVDFDPQDDSTAQALKHKQDYTQALKISGLANKRLGVVTSLFGKQPIHQPVNRVMTQAFDVLQAQGATLIEISEPIDSDDIASNISLHLYELNEDLNEYLANHPQDKPVGSLAALLASGKFDEGIEETIKTAVKLNRQSPDYQPRLAKRQQLQQKLQTIIKANQLDALIFPHQKRLVVPVGETQVERNGSVGSVSGFPSIVVPAGFSEPTQTAPIGMPVGIEFLGMPFTESILIEISYGFEQHSQMRKPPIMINID